MNRDVFLGGYRSQQHDGRYCVDRMHIVLFSIALDAMNRGISRTSRSPRDSRYQAFGFTITNRRKMERKEDRKDPNHRPGANRPADLEDMVY